MISPVVWGLFVVFIVVMLFLDAFVFHQNPHEVRFKEALGWSIFWIALALLFAAGVQWKMGHVKALEFLTGYLIEKALSVDNLFVFLAVFSYFRVQAKYQHRILLWGILGALVMRGLFIWLGVALINRFHWILYIFGIFLIYTGFVLAFKDDKEIHPDSNIFLKILRRIIPVVDFQEGGKFFIWHNGRWAATTLFVVLLVIESTDLMFAIDSIPAVLAVSKDPFIVFSSNVFAILGLRALFFVLSAVLRLFHFLNYGLALILAFVGVKMLGTDLFHIPVAVGVVLTAASVLSLIFPKKDQL
jgi:tellurite resistance protein TerC